MAITVTEKAAGEVKRILAEQQNGGCAQDIVVKRRRIVGTQSDCAQVRTRNSRHPVRPARDPEFDRRAPGPDAPGGTDDPPVDMLFEIVNSLVYRLRSITHATYDRAMEIARRAGLPVEQLLMLEVAFGRMTADRAERELIQVYEAANQPETSARV